MSKPSRRKWEDITDMLTPQGVEGLKVGQVLVFDYEGSQTHLRITRKVRNRVWAKEVRFYTDKEVAAMVEGLPHD